MDTLDLQQRFDELKECLEIIAAADWRKWDEEVRSPDQFVQWAKKRARYVLEKVDSGETAQPAAWIRFCSDGTYEGPIADCDRRMDATRRTSGAWTPLYPLHNAKFNGG